MFSSMAVKQKRNDLDGYRFRNFTGTNMKLYVSDLQLFDDNYDSTVEVGKNVISLEGFRPNDIVQSEFKPSIFFD